MYVVGKPKSIRNHPQKAAIEYAGRESVNLALIRRAYQLHEESPTGYNPKAWVLHPTRVQKHLRDTSDGDEVFLIRVWLSDGSKFKAAWKLTYGPQTLSGDLFRVEWPRSLKRSQKPYRGR